RAARQRTSLGASRPGAGARRPADPGATGGGAAAAERASDDGCHARGRLWVRAPGRLGMERAARPPHASLLSAVPLVRIAARAAAALLVGRVQRPARSLLHRRDARSAGAV